MTRRTRLALALVALGGLAGASTFLGDASEGSADGRGTAIRVFVLLEDNTLLGIDAGGRVVRRTRLGRRPRSPLGARYLALAAKTELRVIVSGDTRGVLAVVDAADGRVRRRTPLPAGLTFRTIEVGPRTGRTYLGGERRTQLPNGFGGRANAAVATVLARSGRELATRILRVPQRGPRRGEASDWQLYDSALARGEGRVFFSYHGPNTQGADRVDVGTRGSLSRCASGGRNACLPSVHGAIEADRDDLLAALGTPPSLARFSPDGTSTEVWPSGFRDAHLMEFARLGDRVFTVESCVKTGGMTVIDLVRREARVLHAPAPTTPLRGLPARAVCGERISVGAGGLIVVMKRGTLSGIGGVMLLDDRGRIRRWIRLRPPPVDVLVLP